MKSMLDSLLSAAWGALAPVRRPFVRKLDDRVNLLVSRLVESELERRLVPTLSAAVDATARTIDRLDALIASTEHSREGTDRALGLLLDEVNRLRERVDALRDLIPPCEGETGVVPEVLDGLAYVEPDGVCTPFPADTPEERARVG